MDFRGVTAWEPFTNANDSRNFYWDYEKMLRYKKDGNLVTLSFDNVATP
jgi:hypothetical protein